MSPTYGAHIGLRAHSSRARGKNALSKALGVSDTREKARTPAVTLRERENRPPNGEGGDWQPGKPGRPREQAEDERLETPVVFSRRKKRTTHDADCVESLFSSSLDKPASSRHTGLDFSGKKAVSRAIYTPSPLRKFSCRQKPFEVGKNPFAVSAAGSPNITRRKPNTPVGFSNTGNTCYLASVVQCMLSIEAFVLEITRLVDCGKGGQITLALFDIIEETKRCELHPMRLDKLKTALASSEHGALFSGHQQQDAHEAYITLLACVKHENGTEYRCPFSHNVVVEMKCESCGHTARVDERGHLNIAIGADASDGGVWRALQRNTQRISKVCERCEKSEEHVRTSLISQMPQALVVQLTRFQFTSVMSKLNDDFTPDASVKISSDGSRRFELRGIVRHHGPYGHCGHYDAQVWRRGGSWFRTNDASVSVIPKADVLRPSRTSYLLFYSQSIS